MCRNNAIQSKTRTLPQLGVMRGLGRPLWNKKTLERDAEKAAA